MENSILNSEPLKKTVKNTYDFTSANVTAKTARKMLLLKMLNPPNVERKLAQQNISTKAVYEWHSKVSIKNKLTCFQYKVVYITFYLLTAIFTEWSWEHPRAVIVVATLMKIYFTFYMNAPVFKFSETKRDLKMSP